MTAAPLARHGAGHDNAPSHIGVPPMPTPADLRAMRILLGYTRQELALMLGEGLSDEHMRKLEAPRMLIVHEGHAALLLGIMARVNAELDAALAQPAPRFLLTYPNDGAFRTYEPGLIWMRFNSAHLMFIARLLDAWMMENHHPEVMQLVPDQYEAFRQVGGLADATEVRLKWAAEHRPLIKMRPGLPLPGRGDRS